MKLLVEIDGQAHAIADCHWVRFDPAGCATGSLYGDLATTIADAHKEFTPLKRDRDRETRAGYRHELLTQERWDTVRPCLSGRCGHRPAVPSAG